MRAYIYKQDWQLLCTPSASAGC